MGGTEMATRKGSKRGTVGKVGKVGTLVKAEPQVPAQTKAELAALVDEVRDEVNLHVDKRQIEAEFAANLLFRKLLGNDSTLALSLDTRTTPAYVAMRAHAGHSLKLTVDGLREHVLIGALN